MFCKSSVAGLGCNCTIEAVLRFIHASVPEGWGGCNATKSWTHFPESAFRKPSEDARAVGPETSLYNHTIGDLFISLPFVQVSPHRRPEIHHSTYTLDQT